MVRDKEVEVIEKVMKELGKLDDSRKFGVIQYVQERVNQELLNKATPECIPVAGQKEIGRY